MRGILEKKQVQQCQFPRIVDPQWLLRSLSETKRKKRPIREWPTNADWQYISERALKRSAAEPIALFMIVNSLFKFDLRFPALGNFGNWQFCLRVLNVPISLVQPLMVYRYKWHMNDIFVLPFINTMPHGTGRTAYLWTEYGTSPSSHFNLDKQIRRFFCPSVGQLEGFLSAMPQRTFCIHGCKSHQKT